MWERSSPDFFSRVCTDWLVDCKIELRTNNNELEGPLLHSAISLWEEGLLCTAHNDGCKKRSISMWINLTLIFSTLNSYCRNLKKKKKKKNIFLFLKAIFLEHLSRCNTTLSKKKIACFQSILITWPEVCSCSGPGRPWSGPASRGPAQTCWPPAACGRRRSAPASWRPGSPAPCSGRCCGTKQRRRAFVKGAYSGRCQVSAPLRYHRGAEPRLYARAFPRFWDSWRWFLVSGEKKLHEKVCPNF